jgi:hypothetical protein
MSDQKSLNVPVKVNFDIDHHNEDSSSRRQGQGTYIEIFSENELTGVMSPIEKREDTSAGHTCPIKRSKKVHVVTPVKPENSTTSAEQQQWVSQSQTPHHVTHKQSDPVHKSEESSRRTTPKQVTPGKPVRVQVRVVPPQSTMVEQKEELKEDIPQPSLKILSTADEKISRPSVAVKTEKSELYKQADHISEEVEEVTMNVTNKHGPVVPEVSAVNQSASVAAQSLRDIREKNMPSPPPKAIDIGRAFKTRPRSHKLVSASDFNRYLSEQGTSSQKASRDSLLYAAVASGPKTSPIPAIPAWELPAKTEGGSGFGGATFPFRSCTSSTGPLDSEIQHHALYIKPVPG